MPLLRDSKRLGFSDRQIASLTSRTEGELRALRIREKIRPSFLRVDTCAAEFETHTPYLYSSYETESEANVTDRKKVIILGGGPNRIGQGIEFDYCCVHAVQALRQDGYETIMVNCNPETVSTDYDTADRLYFEPLTLEDVLEICDIEKPHGVVVQFGGQTPLKLATALERAGVPLLGTSADAIDRAEDRSRFDALLEKLALRRPRSAIAHSGEEALRLADEIGYPVLARPSYVLGGRAMIIAYSREELEAGMEPILEVARARGGDCAARSAARGSEQAERREGGRVVDRDGGAELHPGLRQARFGRVAHDAGREPRECAGMEGALRQQCG